MFEPKWDILICKTCKEASKNSFAHIQSQTYLKSFGISRIDLAQNGQWRLNISIHNVNVKGNCEILKDLINGSCFLGKQELTFRSTVESANSSREGETFKSQRIILKKLENLTVNLTTWSVPPQHQTSLHITANRDSYGEPMSPKCVRSFHWNSTEKRGEENYLSA